MPPSRRRFLSSLAVPVLASIGNSARPVRLQPEDPVVIVGAGIAGLGAARLLADAGRRVIVLEARSQPGGRVRTIRQPFTSGLLGEAGAVRISGAHQRVLRLVRDHNLTLLPFASPTGAPVVTVAGLTLRSPAELRRAAGPLGLRADEAGLAQAELLQRYAGEALAEVSGFAPGSARATWPAYDRVTWPEWLRSRGASPGAITLMTLGGDSRELSALYVLRLMALLKPSDQFYKIDGGMDRLPQALAASLGGRIRFASPVVAVEQRAAGVRVEYRAGDRTHTIRASHLILALPFPALRGIAIRPALSPAKRRAMAELPYFAATRFLLQSRTRFWEEDDLSGYARTDDPAEIWDATYDRPNTEGVLAATAGGAIGERVAAMTEPQAVRFGVDLVGRTFARLRPQFQRGAVVRWAREPWALGAFAVFRPGQMTSLLPEIGRAEKRIHFAGEHTSPWTAWMEGALESAERVAREIL